MIHFHLTRKRTLISVISLAVVLAAIYSLRPEPLPVEVGVVSEGPLQVTVDEDGRARTINRYIVTAPVSGRLERMMLREGQNIRAGDIVARIAAQPLDAPALAENRARLESARARQRAAVSALAQAEASHAQAIRELDRRRKLLEVGALSPEQIEQLELMARSRADASLSARELLNAAVAEVRAAQTSVNARAGGRAASAVTVAAPASGTVLRIPEYSERIVTAGQPLLELGNATALEVVVDVLSTDAVRVQPGMHATLTDWGGNPLVARVRKVEPAAFTRLSALGVEEQRVNVVLDFDNCPDNIGDGYHVQGSIVVWSAERVLTVPASALFTDVGGWSVFVFDQGRARKRNLQIGERGRERAQVIGGLVAGDRVILFPSDQIADGSIVRIER